MLNPIIFKYAVAKLNFSPDVDQATALVVVPKWPTQTWFTTFKNLSEQTLQIKPDVSNLILPNNSATEKTTFMIGSLSGKVT